MSVATITHDQIVQNGIERFYVNSDRERFEAIAARLDNAGLDGWTIVSRNATPITKFADAGVTIDEIVRFAVLQES